MALSRTRALLLGGAIAFGLVATQIAVARADVVESTPSGFAIEEKAHIAATPDKVYAALIQPQNWWNSQHTFSQNAKNLSLDAKAGGCLCEALPNGGSVLHLTVLYAAPGVALRFQGAMGPFQGQGLASTLTFTLTAKDGGTDILLENNVGGFMKGSFGQWPNKADMMMADLVAHLKKYAETP
jgi:uncharacterized protein YndB with AHSA1/START domain